MVVETEKLKLFFFQSPGDTLVATGAVSCLMEQHPGRYQVDVDGTDAAAIFEHNPHITRGLDCVTVINMENPGINYCDKRPVHFLQSYTDYLGEKLGIELKCTTNRPHLWISDEERSWLPQVHEITQKPVQYWVVASGTKKDYTVKGWGRDSYQEVVRQLRGVVQFVQVGLEEHGHPPLDGVIDLRGKTDTRQLIRLCWHAQGGLGGESFLHHIFAAFSKPFVCLASGFLPTSWVSYPTTTILSKARMLPCSERKGCCWKSRTVPLGDGDGKDGSLCELPVFGGSEPVPKCLAMISPEEVVSAIRGYYDGGLLSS